MSDNTWSEVARLRQGLYRFFAATLLPPDTERLAGVVAGAQWIDAAGIEAFAFAGPWHRLTATLGKPLPLHQLENDYVRLFVANVEGTLCPPAESSYGASTNDVPAVLANLELAYRVGGMVSSASTSLPSDHIVTELEFMSVLCEQESRAWTESSPDDAISILDDEWSFLHRHLGQWVPELAKRLSVSSTVDFYAALAGALAAFVHHDHELTRQLRRGQREEATR